MEWINPYRRTSTLVDVNKNKKDIGNYPLNYSVIVDPTDIDSWRHGLNAISAHVEAVTIESAIRAIENASKNKILSQTTQTFIDKMRVIETTLDPGEVLVVVGSPRLEMTLLKHPSLFFPWPLYSTFVGLPDHIFVLARPISVGSVAEIDRSEHLYAHPLYNKRKETELRYEWDDVLTLKARLLQTIHIETGK